MIHIYCCFSFVVMHLPLIFCSKVVYLDHIDFRQRQVLDCIPRISVWKEDMCNRTDQLYEIK